MKKRESQIKYYIFILVYNTSYFFIRMSFNISVKILSLCVTTKPYNYDLKRSLVNTTSSFHEWLINFKEEIKRDCP